MPDLRFDGQTVVVTGAGGGSVSRLLLLPRVFLTPSGSEKRIVCSLDLEEPMSSSTIWEER